ncbi:hypothetical protein A6V39_04835 [Candidatus Mycoplasma haematobovis]|uniref:Uncharacterized protein n=1 Tax=Candidatus Mycoplasma haematobovis TaxID=432608 RepID=A0A1A9QCY0_9MOLU|nr:hypothetical protein [Candidatus Mycoplasma haematobovis]OAL09871.1 hypothetical protein A6V39_04835 [Candidatus Mycoplasma haematobovis]
MLQRKLYLHFPLQKHLVFLLFSAIALDCLYVYLPIFEMKLSFVSIPLIAIGWIYGTPIGFLSGLVVDLISLSWESSFSWLFLLQPALIGSLGGIMKYFHYASLAWLNVLLHCIAIYFFNPFFVLISLLISSLLAIKYKEAFNVLLLNAVIVSLIYGTYCASQYSLVPYSTLLSVRMAKESVKIILATIPLTYLLRNE